jgi:hypothetical protein
MHGLEAARPERDGVHVFNHVYLSVTDEIARRPAADEFSDPRIAAELAVRFAGRYLNAAEDDKSGRRKPPACWRPMLRMRAHPGVDRCWRTRAGPACPSRAACDHGKPAPALVVPSQHARRRHGPATGTGPPSTSDARRQHLVETSAGRSVL